MDEKSGSKTNAARLLVHPDARVHSMESKVDGLKYQLVDLTLLDCKSSNNKQPKSPAGTSKLPDYGNKNQENRCSYC